VSARGRDRVAAVLLAVAPLLAIAVLAGLAAVLVGRGLGEIDPAFLVESPRDAGRAGGIGPFLVATGLVVGVALAAAAPVGLAAAVYLAEFAPRADGRWIGGALDALAAVPSVLFGLFGLAFFCEALGLGWSVLSGGLTVALMILPLFVRLAEEGLRAVPDELRVAGAALGLPRVTVVGRILLPEAAPSIGAGLLLATGRVLAESAALLFTAGAAVRAPDGLLDPGRVLAVHVYLLATEVPGGDARASASALVLLGVVVLSGWLARAAPALVLRRAR